MVIYRINLFLSKAKFRQAKDRCKKVLGSAELVYAHYGQSMLKHYIVKALHWIRRLKPHRDLTGLCNPMLLQAGNMWVEHGMETQL